MRFSFSRLAPRLLLLTMLLSLSTPGTSFVVKKITRPGSALLVERAVGPGVGGQGGNGVGAADYGVGGAVGQASAGGVDGRPGAEKSDAVGAGVPGGAAVNPTVGSSGIPSKKPVLPTLLRVSKAGALLLNGFYQQQSSRRIPDVFAHTCLRKGWRPDEIWERSAVLSVPWYQHTMNGSYIYLHQEGIWWMEDPQGAGVYICPLENEDDGMGEINLERSKDYVEKKKQDEIEQEKKDGRRVPFSGWQPMYQGVEPMPQVHYM